MKKYQIFVSSTYNDLIEERQIAIKAIINQRQIPAGMELFGPMGEKQWDHIKREIDQSDYYLLIVAGKYGSINEQGISYTEAEFDYACSRGIRVIAFLARDIENIPLGKSETSKKRKLQLERFRKKVENNIGLVTYWTDKYELELRIATGIANVLRDYPADSGWIRITGKREEDALYQAGISAENSDSKLVGELIFPSLSNMELEKPQVNYAVNDPSRAVVVCDSAYVQLETRDGRIEKRMVDTCVEFIKLVKDRNFYLPEGEVFCLRSLWFNSISPEVVICLDYLYEYGRRMTFSLEEVKEMFYDGEVLGDGICYETWVRRYPVSMHSDHFYQNNKEFYEIKNDSFYININWKEADFQYEGRERSVISCIVKISNRASFSIRFKIRAEFEVREEQDAKGVHKIVPLYGKDEDGETVFELDMKETKNFTLYFQKEWDAVFESVKPYRINAEAEDDSPRYE